MTSLYKYLIGAGIAILILFMTFFGGCQYGKTRVHCPTISHDTTYVHDTTTYHIIDHKPYYVYHTDTIYKRDTTYLPKLLTKADTLKILSDYYAMHVYDRKWEAKDTLLVNIKDYITENKSVKNVFTYKILRPQTVINNSVDQSIHYARYLYGYVGTSSKDYNQSSIGLLYAAPKWTGGIGYVPYTKGFNIQIGINILKRK
jgi:hypothetical protein